MFTKLHEPNLGINIERRQKSVLGRHCMVKYVFHRSIDEYTREERIDYKTGSIGRTSETKGWA